jgi:nitroimidazol reductase NimA-like FMN-containing flavoprotein (pyridoxamine 5'-phosphate oxidase superfamily)
MDAETREKILTILDQHRIMTIATLRPDGWPQATTVGYANEGVTLYFLCLRDSQKAANLARDDRVSLTIDHDTPEVMATTGLSMAARAQAVADRDEAGKVLRMLQTKFPGLSQPLPMLSPENTKIFRVTPTVISVLDYSKGFGHTDLVNL